MKELTQQELIRVFSAYLPYDLEVLFNKKWKGTVVALIGSKWNKADVEFENGQERKDLEYLTPILYPLSMLTREIEHEGNTFVPMQRLSKEFEMNVIEHCFLEQNAPIKGFDWLRSTSYPVVQRLIEWHFNIFNLDESQYINKATLKN